MDIPRIKDVDIVEQILDFGSEYPKFETDVSLISLKYVHTSQTDSFLPKRITKRP